MKNLVQSMLQNPTNQGKVITLSMVTQEAAKDQGILDFLESYGTDLQVLKNEFKTIENQERLLSRNMGGGRRAIPAVLARSVVAVMEAAEETSAIKHGPDAPVDFKTFIYEMAKYSQTEECVTTSALIKSNFDFDKFKSDYEKKPTSEVLQNTCTNFNELAAQGKIDPVIGREDEILRTIEILCKRKKNNVVLLGKAGVGKTAIAEGIALAIVNKQVPEQLKNAVIFNLEVANMVAGTQYRGQFEEKMMAMLKEFKEMEESGMMPILFIDEIHSIMGSGNSNGLDFANIIKPALSRGQLRCIGTTTTQEFQKFITADKALKRRFAQVMVEEPTRLQTIEILKGAMKYYAEKHDVTYTEQAIVRTVDLSMEFITDSALPDKALDLFDLAGSIHKLKGEKTIDQDQIENAICRLKSLAPDTVRQKRELQEVVPMGPKIKENLFGQDHAVDAVVKVIERSLAGLQEDNKPLGQFLLIGPTGVGKTELAKLLAKEMKAHLERIDMSEFMEQHSVSKLIGSPPGYVGYESQGRLQKSVGEHSRCILLLDEIEKAHPRVLDIFLQAMDNAKITDSQGEEIFFNNAVILMTSNAGARDAAAPRIGLVASSSPDSNKISAKSISNAFTPEFLNRLNGVIHFNSLAKDKMVNVVKKFVKKLVDTKLALKGITLVLSPEAEEWIVNKCYDASMGGRPMERGVQTHVTEAITQSILYGEIRAGRKNVSVTVENDELKFEYT